MTTHIPLAFRQAVVERAGERCEYCLYPQAASYLTFQVEHIIAEKHGGATVVENLALACPYCNRYKGSDLGSLDPASGQLTSFFNPRTQRWGEHFELDGAKIVARTAIGRVTVAILQFNQPDRLAERQRLLQVRKYP